MSLIEMGIGMGLTMEVEIMSKEYIRPSSPTPPHLKNTPHKFSLLDHIMPPVYAPRVLLYPPTPTSAAASTDQKPSLTRSQTLKQSLSETLTRFYPLAGRISRDNLSIDCNDEGAYFIEANVDFSLSEFVEHPQEHLSFLPKLVPPVASSLEYDFTTNSGSGGADVVMVQLTNFSCGGFVISALVAHMIVDGIAISTFLKSWAATSAQAETALAMPNFDSPLIFVPNPNGAVHPREATMRGLYRQFVKQGRSVTTRFVFNASAVAKLKDKAATASIIPSRVEAISAFIWKCAIAAWNVKGAKRPRPSLITHAVNIRRRAVPPFSEYCMGNFVCLAPAIQAPQEEEEDELELSSLVKKMREAITKMDGDVVRELQGEQGLTTVTKLFQDMSTSISSAVAAAAIDDDDHHKNIGGGKMDFIGFTSIAYSGVYDADFGWGKPLWVIPVHEIDHQPFYVNVVRLMDRGELGNGSFEAWVSLGEEEIALLERNEELLSFASLNPSPLPPPAAAPA